MGTETLNGTYIALVFNMQLVKLNNPLMGTETIYLC